MWMLVSGTSIRFTPAATAAYMQTHSPMPSGWLVVHFTDRPQAVFIQRPGASADLTHHAEGPISLRVRFHLTRHAEKNDLLFLGMHVSMRFSKRFSKRLHHSDRIFDQAFENGPGPPGCAARWRPGGRPPWKTSTRYPSRHRGLHSGRGQGLKASMSHDMHPCKSVPRMLRMVSQLSWWSTAVHPTAGAFVLPAPSLSGGRGRLTIVASLFPIFDRILVLAYPGSRSCRRRGR